MYNARAKFFFPNETYFGFYDVLVAATCVVVKAP